MRQIKKARPGTAVCGGAILAVVAGGCAARPAAHLAPDVTQPPVPQKPPVTVAAADDPPASLPAGPLGVTEIDSASAAPLTRDGIAREMELLLPGFASCYDDARRSASRGAWPVRLSLDFTIDPDGRISDAMAAASVKNAQALVACATTLLQSQASFEPAPRAQTEVQFVLDLP